MIFTFIISEHISLFNKTINHSYILFNIQYMKQYSSNLGANILICTPGRFESLLNYESTADSFHLVQGVKSLEWLILDEADKLLELGFKNSYSYCVHYRYFLYRFLSSSFCAIFFLQIVSVFTPIPVVQFQ